MSILRRGPEAELALDAVRRSYRDLNAAARVYASKFTAFGDGDCTETDLAHAERALELAALAYAKKKGTP